jgi:hypothetical protein
VIRLIKLCTRMSSRVPSLWQSLAMTVPRLFLFDPRLHPVPRVGRRLICQWAILRMLRRLKKQQTEFEQLLRSLQQPSLVDHNPLQRFAGRKRVLTSGKDPERAAPDWRG